MRPFQLASRRPRCRRSCRACRSRGACSPGCPPSPTCRSSAPSRTVSDADRKPRVVGAAGADAERVVVVMGDLMSMSSNAGPGRPEVIDVDAAGPSPAPDPRSRTSRPAPRRPSRSRRRRRNARRAPARQYHGSSRVEAWRCPGGGMGWFSGAASTVAAPLLESTVMGVRALRPIENVRVGVSRIAPRVAGPARRGHVRARDRIARLVLVVVARPGRAVPEVDERRARERELP